MDLENHKVGHGVRGKVLSRQFEKRKEPRKRNGRMLRTALLLKSIYLQNAIEANRPEWRYVLIDYRSDNQRIKAKCMTPLEAWKLNKLLAGSGFAWARCSAPLTK